MAQKFHSKGGRRPRALPSVQLIAVTCSEQEAALRRAAIFETLTQMHLLSRRRGRPKKNERKEVLDAA